MSVNANAPFFPMTTLPAAAIDAARRQQQATHTQATAAAAEVELAQLQSDFAPHSQTPLTDVLASIFDDILQDICMDICMQVHRAAHTRGWNRSRSSAAA